MYISKKNIMAFSPSRVVLPSSGGTFQLTYTSDSIQPIVQWSVLKYNTADTSYDVQITSTSTTMCTMTVTAQPNTGTIVDGNTFYLNYRYNGAVAINRRIYSFTVSIDYANTFFPVWQDVYYTNTDMQQLTYDIYDGDNIIYSGRSIAEPNMGSINFTINGICSSYLNSHLPEGFKEGYFALNDYSKQFDIKGNNINNVYTTLGSYKLHNSYAYEPTPKIFLCDPIKRNSKNEYRFEIDRRQYFITSIFNSSNKNISFEYFTIGDKTTNQFTAIVDNTTQYLIIDRENFQDDKVKFLRILSSEGEVVFSVVDTCYEYCLYYCNAYGGWDSLLIKGNAVKKDKIGSNYYTKSFNNNTTEFEKNKYLNTINTEYQLYTDWFTDDEQSRLHHLLESTEVYLHNLNTDKIEPVNITNTQCEYKTFTNNGKKKFYNTINVEVAQTKIRK